MSEKWYVIKVGEEVKKTHYLTDNFVVRKHYDYFDKRIADSENIIILTTPSKEIAESTKRALDEQLRKQSY
ncbi:hypothetical protein [Lactococcus phage 712]|uniref:Uncharacterized protein n=1 Tax=Lactococcus phage 712 TaxID=2892346 RepID=Q09WR3_9CAUD|nr:hypothetical protein LPV712_gp041 [Lactococcus phage 712]ABB77608.1 hypothetical protein [Lactococcus phage 712]